MNNTATQDSATQKNGTREKLRFTDGLIDYLQEVDYRLATSREDKEKIYKFRYESYLRDKSIQSNNDERFTDDYDKMDNCWTFGINYQSVLASSIRIHLVDSQTPASPSFDVFPDVVGPLIESGHRVIDPTKMVSNSSATNYFPVLPFLAFRMACMASDYLDADYCLISIFEGHVGFYKRIFGLEPVCEPRPYPKFNSRVCLMQADVAQLWDGLIDKYPVFRSTYTERRMLFEKPNAIIQGANDQLVEINTNAGKMRVN